MAEERILTEFNSNKATLQRIDTALRNASNASLHNDYLLWFKYLGILKREAIVKMSEDEAKNAEDLFTKLERKLSIFFNSNGTRNSLYVNIDSDLDKFETFLRRIMDSRGMLLRDAEKESGL